MSVSVSNQELDIDVADELQPFIDKFSQVKLRDDKLQACSPFREDSHPSFAVNLENGSWIDSGSVDQYNKGHFIELLSFLREEQFEDTVGYLLKKYGISYKEVDELHLDTSWMMPVPAPKVFTDDELKPYSFRHPYLAGRGVSEKVQKAFKIGYDREKKAVMMAWMDKEGQVVNMKFRSIESKKFWYAKEGQRIKFHLYGLHWVLKLNCKKVWITESEIDALKLWSNGMPAVACGTASMSDAQRKLLLNSPIEEIVIASDNDPAGRKFSDQLKSEFTGIFKISSVKYESQWKDVGDIPDCKVQEYCKNTESSLISLELNM